MAESAIEWTDATWNPISGCDRVSPGCANCYALTLAKRLKAMGQPGYQRDGGRASGPGFGVTLHPHKLAEPLRWRKPRMVFVNSMSDLFHDEVSDGYIAHVFSVMARADRHTFQVLTKRPERARELLNSPRFWYAVRAAAITGVYPQVGVPFARVETPLLNVWLGVSIENARYTWRADVLRQTPAAVRFISAEPLLGSLFKGPSERWLADRRSVEDRLAAKGAPPLLPDVTRPLDLSGIDWAIIGGESGPGARPFHLEHARELVEAALGQCADCTAVGPAYTPQGWHVGFNDDSTHWRDCSRKTAVFVKQLGAKPVVGWIEQAGTKVAGHALALHDRKGGDPSQWPTDLRIREFPRSAA